jgi:hypothetical protein
VRRKRIVALCKIKLKPEEDGIRKVVVLSYPFRR